MNHLNWHYIMDKQPEHDEHIIQCDPCYMGHRSMGIRRYYQMIPWDELIKKTKEMDYPLPDFYWISAKEFPFPVEVDDAP